MTTADITLGIYLGFVLGLFILNAQNSWRSK
jgi:hypothetical protein